MSNKADDFAEVYHTHFGSLYKSCLHRVHDREMVVDIVQDTFTKAWRYVMLGGVIRNEKAFLYKTMRNIVVSYYRSKRPFSLDTLLENEAYEPPLVSSAPIINHAEGMMAAHQLKNIPVKYREVVNLHFDKGLSFREIAEISHEAENTVIVRFHRAIKKVRVLFLR